MPRRSLQPTHEDKKAQKLLAELAKKIAAKKSPIKKAASEVPQYPQLLWRGGQG